MKLKCKDCGNKFDKIKFWMAQVCIKAGWELVVSGRVEEEPTSTFGSRPEALVGSTCAFSWEHMGLHPGPVTLHMHM